MPIKKLDPNATRTKPLDARAGVKVETKLETKLEAKVEAKVDTKAEPTQRKVGLDEPLFGNVGSVAAKKALGLTDDVHSQPKGAGARAAKAGLGFFDKAIGKSLRKGVLVALAGLSILNGIGTGLQGNSPVFHRAPVQRTSTLDVRLQNSHTQAHHVGSQHLGGQRALSDATALLKTWEAEQQANPSFQVTSQHARDLVLAALLPATPAAGADLATFAKKNLGAETQAVLGALLDGSTFKLADDARALLEVSAGRALAVAADGKVRVLGDQADGKLHLQGVPGASVEAINLSTIPTKRLHLDDTFVVGKVGADGTLAADMEMRAGDQIRMRLKLPDGTATQWVDFRATGLGDDVRNAEVALFRVGLSDEGNGKVSLSNINSSRAISEPGAVLRFINERTSESTDLTLNSQGTFDGGLTLPGKAGDTYSVRVSDGTNDKDLQHEISKLTVREAGKPSVIEGFDLADPTLHHDELDAAGKPKFAAERFRGPLFDVGGAVYTDAVQGQIGDCFFPAAISAIAFHKPGTFEKMMKQVEEVDAQTGQSKVWYEVTFKEADGWKNGKQQFKDVAFKVDGDLFVRSWGGPLYGSDDGVRGTEDMEMWFSILEKAYAQWKGASYESIGNGGGMDDVFQDILGIQTSTTSVSPGSADQVWKQIKKAVDGKQPVGAGTHGEDQEAIYANSGVYANHAYSVLGYEVKDGVKYVQLRNPWGESEPHPGDGKNDGIFKLKLEDFTKLYSTLYYSKGN